MKAAGECMCIPIGPVDGLGMNAEGEATGRIGLLGDGAIIPDGEGAMKLALPAGDPTWCTCRVKVK